MLTLAGHTVLIRDGIIHQVAASNRVRIPAGASRIDARGKYVMPGWQTCTFTWPAAASPPQTALSAYKNR